MKKRIASILLAFGLVSVTVAQNINQPGGIGPTGPQGPPGANGNDALTNQDGTISGLTNAVQAGITNVVVNVNIPGIAAKGVLTNQESQIFYANTALINDGVSDNTTNVASIITNHANGWTVEWPNETVVCASNWVALSSGGVVNFSPTNVIWNLNGVQFSVTKSNTAGGCGFFSVKSSQNFTINGPGTISLPIIATNDATSQAGAAIDLEGTNAFLSISGLTIKGGRFGIANYLAPTANIYPNLSYLTFISVGNFTFGDGAATAFPMQYGNMDYFVISNCYRAVERWNPVNGQRDTGGNSYEHFKCIDVQHSILADTYSSGNSNETSVLFNDWDISEPDQTNSYGVFAPTGFSTLHAVNVTLQNITFHLDALNDGENQSIDAKCDSNLFISNFQGWTTSSGDDITANKASVIGSTFGGLTANSGTTWTSINNNFITALVNNGTLAYIQDTAGNVSGNSFTAAGTLSVAGANFLSTNQNNSSTVGAYGTYINALNVGADLVVTSAVSVLTNPPFSICYDSSYANQILTSVVFATPAMGVATTGPVGQFYHITLTNGTGGGVVFMGCTNASSKNASVWDSGAPPYLKNKGDNIFSEWYFQNVGKTSTNTNNWRYYGANLGLTTNLQFLSGSTLTPSSSTAYLTNGQFRGVSTP